MLRDGSKHWRFKDLTHKTFGRLRVIFYLGTDENRRAHWLCRCSCGSKPISIEGGALKAGRTVSCGCYAKEVATQRRIDNIESFTGPRLRHGQFGTAVHRTWTAMIARCTNPRRDNYKHYGGRGIKVCERWMKFENFYADMGDRPEGKTIDRKDVNGDYCPENCKWSTQSQQNMNRRKSIDQ